MGAFASWSSHAFYRRRATFRRRWVKIYLAGLLLVAVVVALSGSSAVPSSENATFDAPAGVDISSDDEHLHGGAAAGVDIDSDDELFRGGAAASEQSKKRGPVSRLERVAKRLGARVTTLVPGQSFVGEAGGANAKGSVRADGSSKDIKSDLLLSEVIPDESTYATLLTTHFRLGPPRLFDARDTGNSATFAVPSFDRKKKQLNFKAWAQPGVGVLRNGQLVHYCGCNTQGIKAHWMVTLSTEMGADNQDVVPDSPCMHATYLKKTLQNLPAADLLRIIEEPKEAPARENPFPKT